VGEDVKHQVSIDAKAGELLEFQKWTSAGRFEGAQLGGGIAETIGRGACPSEV
jgi:hypothetical protein